MKYMYKTEYAIKVIIYLGQKKEKVSSELIAKDTDIPRNYLLKVLSLLNTHKLVKVYMGAYGGYVLNKPIEQITLYEVVQATEVKLDMKHLIDIHHRYERVIQSFMDIEALVNEELAKVSMISLMK
ncbi:MAG: Rrf2 family transcriptional regulator [Longicatena sp.]